jgi:hypothetical protein
MRSLGQGIHCLVNDDKLRDANRRVQNDSVEQIRLFRGRDGISNIRIRCKLGHNFNNELLLFPSFFEARTNPQEDQRQWEVLY